MSQATFADIDGTEPKQQSDTVPRQLTNAATVGDGDRVMLDRQDMNVERAYTVIEARSNSLTVKRGDNKITLRRRRGEWYHDSTAYTHDVRLIATADAPILRCDDCGEAHDPADFARRVDQSYYCAGCDK